MPLEHTFPDLRAFGARLRQLRTDQGLSQEQLAERVGVHRTSVGALERGERNSTLEQVHALARALGIEVGDLFPRPVRDDAVPTAAARPPRGPG